MADDTTKTQEALERVLSHAESHGEVYHGACADHKTLRDAIAAAGAGETVPADGTDATGSN